MIIIYIYIYYTTHNNMGAIYNVDNMCGVYVLYMPSGVERVNVNMLI